MQRINTLLAASIVATLTWIALPSSATPKTPQVQTAPQTTGANKQSPRIPGVQASPRLPLGGSTPVIDPSNPNNDVDLVGVLHNDILDAVISNKAAIGTDPNLWGIKVKQLVDEMLCLSGPQLTATFSAMTPGALPDDCSLTSVEVDFLGQLLSLQDSAQATGLSNFISSVKQLEADILSTPLSSRARLNLLSSCSVARHSTCYWFNEATAAGGSLWAAPPPAGLGTLAINWGDIGKDDVNAAVVTLGGIGLMSLLTGPPGWVAGGTAVVGSAASGSALSLLEQLW